MDQKRFLAHHGIVIEKSHLIGENGSHTEAWLYPEHMLTCCDVEVARQVCRFLVAPFLNDDVDLVATSALGEGWHPTFSSMFATLGAEAMQEAGVDAQPTWLYEGRRQIVGVRNNVFARPVGKKRVLLLETKLWAGVEPLSPHLIPEQGGEVVGMALICNIAGEVTAEQLSVPRLEQLSTSGWGGWFPEADCPACRKKVPMVVDLGLGRKFQKEHPDYKGGFITTADL